MRVGVAGGALGMRDRLVNGFLLAGHRVALFALHRNVFSRERVAGFGVVEPRGRLPGANVVARRALRS